VNLYHATRRPRLRALTTTLALTAALALSLPALAQAEFGFAPINANPESVATAPAFPADTAVWAGTCDLASADTSNGGAGTAPSIRRDCIDIGRFAGGFEAATRNGLNPWVSGEEPTWRLTPVTQAGAHPDASASFYFSKCATCENPGVNPDGYVKDIIVRLPPGVVGSPTALPRCPATGAQFMPPTCPADTQAGVSTLDLGGFPGDPHHMQPVYNVEARDTVTAEFTIGGVAEFFNVPVTARGRTNGDYGVDTLALQIPVAAPLDGQVFTFWGVPWAAEHDPFRIEGTQLRLLRSYIPTEGLAAAEQNPYEPSWGPIQPFFTNPTRCTESPLSVGFDIDSWDNPGATLNAPEYSPNYEDPNWKRYEVEPPLITGCDKLHFDPSIALHPTVAVADSPAGLDVRLATPQNNELPDEPPYEVPGEGASQTEIEAYVAAAEAYWKTDAGLATAHLKDTVVQLPKGTSFNPAAADGIQGCTIAQVGMTSAGPPVQFNNDKVTCPESAKIGTLKIDTPLLPEPLEGVVYVAKQNDNPFPGSLTAIYLVAQDEERGLSVKLAGKVDLDPVTGQISTTFVDNPQLPINDFELHFKSGSRAPLAMPPVCGQFRNSATLTPWSFPDSGPVEPIEDPFDIASMPNGLGCVTQPQDRSFAPGFEAGTTATQAGASTNFALNVTRRDGEQELSALSLKLAPGITAKLAGIPYCPDATIAAIPSRSGLEETNSPSCPAGSQLGDVGALAGAGSTPLFTPGKLYLAGPYDPDGAGPKPAAPISVVAVVPAIAGGSAGNPAFDLGNVVVRSAAYVDPKTAQVNVAATHLPYIIDGVPLRTRKVAVQITKPGFMLNPTNCEPMSVDGQIGGAADPFNPSDDTTAAVSDRFQVGGCKALGFKPQLSLRLFGKTRRAAYQRLRAVVRARPGDANIARAAVTLPHSAFLAQNHIRTVCTRVQFAVDQCPAGSIYGRATAITPLLDYPLEGPVYLRSSDNPLPDLVAALRGPASQPIEVALSGRTDSVHGALRNSFDLVPDAPVSKFTLELFGGSKGLVVNSENLCAKTQLATVRLGAQNGRRRNFRPVVGNSCPKKHKNKRHHRRRAAR